MTAPGEYVPDPTEGITRISGLPAPRLEQLCRDFTERTCPRCGLRAGRYGRLHRTLHDLGDPRTGVPIDLFVTLSKHRCRACGHCFTAPVEDLALPNCHYTRRVQELAVRVVVEDGLPYRTASWQLWRDHRVFVPFATIQNWVEAAGKKKLAVLPDAYLDRALADFSGYLAIDEVYDGPFCILSIVDNRRYQRLTFQVLDHAPTHDDIRSCLGGFKAQLDRRGLTVRAITTDGSNLYPVPLAELWPNVPHQVCSFHVLKDITQAVLHALAQLRKEQTARIPKLGRGRPRKADKRRAARIARQKQRVADLFEHRHLFVRHHLNAAEKVLLRRLTAGLPRLRTLRGIMDEVYRLFDRRCKTATALRKLSALRRRVKRFKRLSKSLSKLWSPTLEKALVFLDDRLLPATSNAVERANRRFRKAQGSVYSVRTKRQLERRLALDLHREQQTPARQQTLQILHKERNTRLALH